MAKKRGILTKKEDKLMEVPILSFNDTIRKLKDSLFPHQEAYLAMYSSWFGGIILDPS